MDTDEINALEDEIRDCKSVRVAANYLYLKTAKHGFSRDCCLVWATYVLRPSLRVWARKVALKMGQTDKTRLT